MELNSIFKSGSKVLKFETICQNQKYVQNNNMQLYWKEKQYVKGEHE
jgi:hypothetical protein